MEDGEGFDDALARAKVGDESGFAALWASLHPHLCRYLQGLGCTDIDDVASETWLQAIRDLKRFTGVGTDFRAWLFTIGRHRAIDAARAQARFHDKILQVAPADEQDGSPVEDEVLFRLSGQWTAALIAGLSEAQATVVLLRVIAGADTDTTARMLGRSRGAIRGCLHRALRTLAADPRVRALTVSDKRARRSA